MGTDANREWFCFEMPVWIFLHECADSINKMQLFFQRNNDGFVLVYTMSVSSIFCCSGFGAMDFYRL